MIKTFLNDVKSIKKKMKGKDNNKVKKNAGDKGIEKEEKHINNTKKRKKNKQ